MNLNNSPEIENAEIRRTFAQKPRKKTHTRTQWIMKFAENPSCHYCERPLMLSEATKDHLTPTCRGGRDTIANIVPACIACNQAKGWRTEAEFRQMQLSDPQPPRGISEPKIIHSLEETLDEPNLLKRVVKERLNLSWWRNQG